jgi:hypothetical protein
LQYDTDTGINTYRYRKLGITAKPAHVQLVMMHHRYGADHGVSLDFLSSTQFQRNGIMNSPNLMSFDARIVADQLLLRSQLWVLLPGRGVDFWPEERLPLCPHYIRHPSPCIPIQSIIKYPTLAKLIWDGIGTGRNASCMKCPTHGYVQIFKISELKRSAVCFTRWVNVGDDLHPYSAEWKNYLAKKRNDGAETMLYGPRVCSSFEAHGGLSLRELTLKNMEILRSEASTTSAGFFKFLKIFRPWKHKRPAHGKTISG